MSERRDPNDSTTFTPRDADDSAAERGTPPHLTPAGTRGPVVGGQPAMPGTPEHEREVQHTKGRTPLGITTGLLWTVGIFSIVAIVVILMLTL